MFRYVSLVSWTEQGVKSVKDTVKRAEMASSAAEQMGGRLTSILWTQGKYDLVVTSEFPDEESATAFLLRLATTGNLRTVTMRAWSGSEMSEILDKMG